MANTTVETPKMTDEQKDLLRKYLSDMNALEGHIYQAIDKQVKGTEDEPDINPVLANIRDTLERHVTALQKRLDALGGNPANPIKEAGASILGWVAGLVDKLRSEEVSKNMRDNYTALSLSTVSYVMLATTALACNDRETADLAARHLKDNANFVMEIGKLIPYVVVRDLKDEANLNSNAIEEAQQIYSEAWN